MSERRFVIYETHPEPSNSIANPGFGGTQVVTEAELKRRIILAFLKYNPEENNWPQVLPILLYGEGEKSITRKEAIEISQHILKQAEQERLPCDWGEGEKGEDFPGPEDILKMRGKAQPSPTPTREEWEAWANKVACFFVESSDSIAELEKRLLSMPIVPKGGDADDGLNRDK